MIEDMDFDRLINPRVVALIGASNDPRRQAYRFLEGWISDKYQGKIYPINPKYKEILGLRTYPDIREIPTEEEIDYVLIAVPALKVPAEIRKCVERGGIKFVVIFASGFSEIGDKHLEEEILQMAKGNFRVLGPNCIGVYCTESRLGYFTDQPIISEGDVSFISQSGTLTRTFIWMSISRGYHIRAAVSIGNMIDVSFNELFEYFMKDPKTRIIAGYLESVGEGQKFFTLLKSITPHKPVAILKCGRTPKGKVAALSHTGALTGSYEIFSSMVKQGGGILVESIEELADVTSGLEYLRNVLPAGKNIAIINAGGGIAVQITDICESNGFQVANLEKMTQKTLQDLLPRVNVIIDNPIDLGASGFNPKILGQAITIISNDSNIDSILLVQEIERFHNLDKRFQVPNIGEAYAEIIQKHQNPKKPLIVVLSRSWEIDQQVPYTLYQKYRKDLLAKRIPSFPTTQRALNTLKKLVQYRNFLKNHNAK